MTIFCSSIVAVFLLGMANDANADSADAVSSRLQVHVRFSNEQTLFSGWLFRILGIQIPTWKFVEFFTDMLGNGVPLAPPPPRPPLLHAIDGCIAPYTLRGSGQVGVLTRQLSRWSLRTFMWSKNIVVCRLIYGDLRIIFFNGILNRGAL
jgi:hypothetical protein